MNAITVKKSILYDENTERLFENIGEEKIADFLYKTKLELSKCFNSSLCRAEDVFKAFGSLKGLKDNVTEILEGNQLLQALSAEDERTLKSLSTEIDTLTDQLTAHTMSVQEDYRKKYEEQEAMDYLTGLEEYVDLHPEHDEEYELEDER